MLSVCLPSSSLINCGRSIGSSRRHLPRLQRLLGCITILLVRRVVDAAQPPSGGFVEQATTLHQLDSECWRWQSTLRGSYLDGKPQSKRRVWITDGCARKCDERDDCRAWSFDWKAECFLFTNVTAVVQTGEVDERGADLIAHGKKGARDCRPLDERRPCDQYNLDHLWSVISHDWRDSNLTVEECRQKCRETVECRYFTHRGPHCFLKNWLIDDNKV
ncbi:unnamed protein product, partial [Vitrella brassicaformis CCMP3155]